MSSIHLTRLDLFYKQIVSVEVRIQNLCCENALNKELNLIQDLAVQMEQTTSLAVESAINDDTVAEIDKIIGQFDGKLAAVKAMIDDQLLELCLKTESPDILHSIPRKNKHASDENEFTKIIEMTFRRFEKIIDNASQLSASTHHEVFTKLPKLTNKPLSDQLDGCKPAKLSALIVSRKTTRTSFSCLCCNELNHTMTRCPLFLSKTISERYSFAYHRRICTNCLKADHVIRNCSSSYCRVTGCQKKLQANP